VEAYERGIGQSRFGRKFDEEILPNLSTEKFLIIDTQIWEIDLDE
jgi:hypothetical protein